MVGILKFVKETKFLLQNCNTVAQSASTLIQSSKHDIG